MIEARNTLQQLIDSNQGKRSLALIEPYKFKEREKLQNILLFSKTRRKIMCSPLTSTCLWLNWTQRKQFQLIREAPRWAHDDAKNLSSHSSDNAGLRRLRSRERERVRKKKVECIIKRAKLAPKKRVAWVAR